MDDWYPSDPWNLWDDDDEYERGHGIDCVCETCLQDHPERLYLIAEYYEEVCPHCSGTTLSPYPDDGGSCPHCFGGKVPSDRIGWRGEA